MKSKTSCCFHQSRQFVKMTKLCAVVFFCRDKLAYCLHCESEPRLEVAEVSAVWPHCHHHNTRREPVLLRLIEGSIHCIQIWFIELVKTDRIVNARTEAEFSMRVKLARACACHYTSHHKCMVWSSVVEGLMQGWVIVLTLGPHWV